MNHSNSQIIRFYRLIDEARFPQRADRSAAGTLPTRAYRYCDAVTTATSLRIPEQVGQAFRFQVGH
jgi:hypothetical protein